MRNLSSLRIAAVALSFVALSAGATLSFADTAQTPQPPQQQAMQPSQSQGNSYSPYDGSNFVLQSNNIHN
jgi:hypothetical protein